MDMVLRPEVVAYLRDKEELRLEAYQDQAGIWTIGYGSITYRDGRKVKKGDRVTSEQAMAEFEHDLEDAAGPIRVFLKAKGIELGDWQFSALVSFAFNVGHGPIITPGRSIHDALVKGRMMAAADAFLLYDKVTKNSRKVRSRGLALRRAEERRFFLNGLH